MAAGYWIAAGIMVLAGIGMSLQAPMNARLAGAVGGAVPAAMLSFGVGFALLVFLTLMRADLPTLAQLRTAPWWAWGGGLLGAWFVWGAAFAVPRLGVVTLLAMIIFGQILAGLVLDAIGAFGLPAREIDWRRILAVLLVLSGALLSRV
jgi:transporter family-2 protein